jgi:hypothetical protein
MSAPNGRAFRITGASGLPVDIEAGEYYFNTKARCREMMVRDDLSGEARRVYACLELATMAWKQELAVVMDAGGVRPMTPTDISKQTGLSKQNTRRALVELENQGLAERRGTEGRLTKGRVEIYSWAVPRAAKQNGSQHATTKCPDWFPDEWAPLRPLIARFKIKISIDEEGIRDYFAEGEQIARDYETQLEVAAEFLKRVCAGSPLYKEERTERTEEKESSSSDPLQVQEEMTTTPPLPDPEEPTEPPIPPEPEVIQNLPVEEPRPRSVLQKLGKRLSNERATWSDATVGELWRKTKAKDPDLTAYDVVIIYHQKLPLAKQSVVGFMLTAIPEAAGGEGWQIVKETARRRAEVERGEVARAVEYLANPAIADYERSQIQKFLNEVELLE